MIDLTQAIENAARELPENWCIIITVENGSASVELSGPDKYGFHTSTIDSADRTLAEQVEEALKYAKAKEE